MSAWFVPEKALPFQAEAWLRQLASSKGGGIGELTGVVTFRSHMTRLSQSPSWITCLQDISCLPGPLRAGRATVQLETPRRARDLHPWVATSCSLGRFDPAGRHPLPLPCAARVGPGGVSMDPPRGRLWSWSLTAGH